MAFIQSLPLVFVVLAFSKKNQHARTHRALTLAVASQLFVSLCCDIDLNACQNKVNVWLSLLDLILQKFRLYQGLDDNAIVIVFLFIFLLSI